MVSCTKFKWKTDFEKDVLMQNFDQRGWQKAIAGDPDDWNLFWANPWTVK